MERKLLATSKSQQIVEYKLKMTIILFLAQNVLVLQLFSRAVQNRSGNSCSLCPLMDRFTENLCGAHVKTQQIHVSCSTFHVPCLFFSVSQDCQAVPHHNVQ